MSAQSLINITESEDLTKHLLAIIYCARNKTMSRKEIREEYTKLDLKPLEFAKILKFTDPNNEELLYNELTFLDILSNLMIYC